MTNIDLTSTQLQIEMLKNQQKSAQNALSDAEYNFKQLAENGMSYIKGNEVSLNETKKQFKEQLRNAVN